MPIERVVINASPLICLSKAALLDLLPELFKEIIVPADVVREIGDPGICQAARARITSSLVIPPSIAAWDLGPGESAVMALCLDEKTRWAIIDDREACRCADALGCLHTGTIGILLLAKKKGIIPAVRPSVIKLSAAGLWMSERFKNDIIRLAGE